MIKHLTTLVAGLLMGMGMSLSGMMDPAKVLEVLGGGLATSRVLEMRGPGMIKGEFEPGFRIDLHRKDLNNTLATARTQGSPIPVTALVSQFFDTASSAGRGQLDHSALMTVIEDLAGVQVKDVK